MRNAVLLLFLLLYSCGNPPEAKEDIPPGKVRLHVGDREINAANPDAVLAPTRWWVNMHGDAEGYAREREKFSTQMIQVAAMVTYLEDTRNEGHYRFLATTPPQVAADAIEGFRAAGLGSYADVLGKALDKVNGGELEDLDFQFVDYELLDLNEKKDPLPAIMEYIRHNREAFYYDELVNKPRE